MLILSWTAKQLNGHVVHRATVWCQGSSVKDCIELGRMVEEKALAQEYPQVHIVDDIGERAAKTLTKYRGVQEEYYTKHAGIVRELTKYHGAKNEQVPVDNMYNIRALCIIGRRWFDRHYGNTYHTVEIYINGRCQYRSNVEYGYGEQYLQTALEWLDAKAFTLGKLSPSRIRQYCADQGIMYVCSVSDVLNKKDL